jgi:hypothetical protein
MEIADSFDLLAKLRHRTYDIPMKLALSKYVWDIDLDWTPDIYQNVDYVQMEKMLQASNQEFIDDMVKYGRPSRDYVLSLWYTLEELRKEMLAKKSAQETAVA